MTKPIITLLRLEAALVFLASLSFYHLAHGNWWLFVLLLLVPDVSMIGYLKGPKLGAATYNLGHAYLLPGMIAIIYLIATARVPALLFVWFAHIALDRLLGFGLKDPSGFQRTHLGRIGNK